jgi:hypothetical protein
MPIPEGNPEVFEREWPLRVGDLDRYGRQRLSAAARHTQDPPREWGLEAIHPTVGRCPPTPRGHETNANASIFAFGVDTALAGRVRWASPAGTTSVRGKPILQVTGRRSAIDHPRVGVGRLGQSHPIALR